MQSAKVWQCRTRSFSLERPLVMGILNVTPDSFSDGGEHNRYEDAVAWGVKLAEDGADIVDVGGESTRPGAAPVSEEVLPHGTSFVSHPGAAPVSEEEELRRVIPVVRALSSRGIAVSVDTSRSSVMEESVRAGAEILNDVRAFTLQGSLDAAASSGAGLVVMHGWEAAAEDQARGDGLGIVEHVIRYLRKRQEALEAAGVSSASVCWDPGFGFGKTHEENFELLARTDDFVREGQPFLMALSRKRSIGAATGEADARARTPGSVAGALIAVERGAQVVRVHDVRETRDALAVFAAVRRAEQELP